MAALIFFFSSRRRHTRFDCDWSSDVCSSDLATPTLGTNGGKSAGEPAATRNVVGKLIGESRSEEHTSELQSQSNLVCRLLLEKKNKHQQRHSHALLRRPAAMLRFALSLALSR